MAQNWSALSRLLTLWLWCAKWLRLLFKCIYMRQFNMNVFSASSRHIRCLLHCPVRVLFIFDTSCCRLRTSRQANKQTHAHSLSRTPINHMSDGCHSSVMFCVRGVWEVCGCPNSIASSEIFSRIFRCHLRNMKRSRFAYLLCETWLSSGIPYHSTVRQSVNHFISEFLKRLDNKNSIKIRYVLEIGWESFELIATRNDIFHAQKKLI